jgi:hypothetical protein
MKNILANENLPS